MKTIYNLSVILALLIAGAVPAAADADPEYLRQGYANAARMRNVDPNRFRGGFGGGLLNSGFLGGGLGGVLGGGRSKVRGNVSQTGIAFQTESLPLFGRIGFAKQWASYSEEYSEDDAQYRRNAGNKKQGKQRQTKQKRPTAANVREHIRQVEEALQMAIDRDAPEERIQELENELVQSRALLRKIEGPAAVSSQPTRRAPSPSDTGVTRRRNPIPDPVAPADEGDEEEE